MATFFPRLALPLIAWVSLTQAAQAPDEIPRFRVEAYSSTLEVRVVDENGRFIRGLSAADFQVRDEEGRRPIRLVEEQVGVRLDLAILVDIGSGTSSEALREAREAILELIHLLSPDDRITLAVYDREVQFLAGPTSDRPTLVEALWNIPLGGRPSRWKRLGSLFGSSGLTGFAVDEALLQLSRDLRGLPVILVFSAAFGNLGPGTEEHVLERGGRVFAVGWKNRAGDVFNLGGDRAGLERLVNRSGGVFYPGDAIAERLRDLAEAMKSYYTLVYVPATDEGGGDVQVEVVGHPGCRVSYRRR